MLLWMTLFSSLLAIFVTAVLVWWRIDSTKREQKFVKGILAGVNSETPVVTVTTPLLPPPPSRGLRQMFKPTAPAGPGEKAGWSAGGLLILTGVMCLAGLLVGSKLSELIGPAAPAIATAVFGVMPWIYRSKQRNKRLKAIEEQFPDALDFLGRSIRAGNAFSVAFELLAGEATEPLKSELLKVVREMALGSSLEDALNGLVARVPLIEIRFFVSGVLLQRETGGNLGEILGKLAVSVRERLRLHGHVKAASGQARLTASVLTVLPIATVIMLKLVSPEYMNSLTGDPLGRNILAAAVVSQVLGYLVMKKIVKIEV
jgi:tight adherence protein B